MLSQPDNPKPASPTFIGAPSSTPTPAVEALLDELRREFPKFVLRSKASSPLSLLIHHTLRLLTLGQMRTYMTHYHTVIGYTLFVPGSWAALSNVQKLILLRHERVHLRQRRRMSFLGMAFIYLVPWFPLGLAYGRARLEWEAYTETLRATYELLGPAAAHDPALRCHILRRFCGPDYGWMWPFPRQLDRWYDDVLRELDASSKQPVQSATNDAPCS